MCHGLSQMTATRMYLLNTQQILYINMSKFTLGLFGTVFVV